MFSSFTQAKMMIRDLESNRKNRRNRRPIFVRRQCRNVEELNQDQRTTFGGGSLADRLDA